jgi:hypothetical protein
MLVLLTNIEGISADSQFTISLMFNNQIHRYAVKVEKNRDILGVSLGANLFYLITDISPNEKASQSLIRAVLNLYNGHNINLPLVLGELQMLNINLLGTDF